MATKKSRPYKVKDSSKAPEPTPTQMLWRRLAWLCLTGLWAFVALSLISFDAGDTGHAVWPPNSPANNLTGSIGATVSYALLKTLGFSVLVPMVFAAAALWVTAQGKAIQQPLFRAAGAAMIATAMAGLLQVAVPSTGPLPNLAGGTVGYALTVSLLPGLNVLGTVLTLLVGLLIGLIVGCDELLFAIPRAIMNASKPAAARAGQATLSAGRVAGAGAGVGAKHAGTGLWAGLLRVVHKTKTIRVSLNDLDEPVEVEVTGRRSKAALAAAVEPKPKRRRKVEELEEEEIEELEEAAEEYEDEYEVEEEEDEYEAEEEDEVGAPQVFDRDALKEKIAALPVRFAQSQKSTTTAEDLVEMQNAAELEGYIFPGLDLLEEPEEGFNEKLEELVREQAESLESSLQEYRIDGEVVDIESGPAITLYHVELAPGTKVSQLTAVSSDLARSLKAVNIRIVSNMAGRSTVGIEVPNPTRERVRLKELMGNRKLFSKMKLPMFLGKDAAGDPLISDLTKMPHMLIAGTTGSGKSVCMNTIIMSFLYTKKPNELKLILVDPKMVEMSQFKDIPHLMCPVVTEMSKAAAILEWAMTKMDERYELLVEAGCRDITSYNNLEFDELIERMTPHGRELSEEQKARIPRKLPYIVFVIDELADLMMTNKEVEGSIIRIAQKARAVGIHMILATQRPQANVVTGLIKSNMPCRIAFKVSSGMDSRIVLDQKGGELLLGQGDMLYLNGSTELQRAQGTLVDDHEIRAVTRFLKEIAGPNYERQLVQIRGEKGGDEERIFDSENHSSASLAAAQEDPMFDRAVEIVLETKRGSVSLLQRRLAIGYTRSSRLIDLMGIAGIISDHKGSQARDVMITEEEWEAIKELAEEESGGDQMLLNSPEIDGEDESDSPDAEAPFAVEPELEVEAEVEDEEAEAFEEEEVEEEEEEEAELVDEEEEGELEEEEEEEELVEAEDEYEEEEEYEEEDEAEEEAEPIDEEVDEVEEDSDAEYVDEEDELTEDEPDKAESAA